MNMYVLFLRTLAAQTSWMLAARTAVVHPPKPANRSIAVVMNDPRRLA